MLKPYKERVTVIREEITNLGKAVLEANQSSLETLKNSDFESFKKINLSTRKLIQKSNEIDNMIVATLALYSPEARDLRELVSYLKITNEFVRAGANTRSFLKMFRNSYSDELNCSAVLEYAIPLQKAASLSLEITIDMIANTDIKSVEDNYNKVIVEESKTDDLYSMIEKNILKLISKNLELSKDYFDLLSSFRKVQKIADRATSVASLLLFAQIGGEIEQS